jgi:hypothetical protein
MPKDRVVEVKAAAAQAARERDVAIRNVRDQLMKFMETKLQKERRKKLRALGPDVLCMVEGLAESMAIVHFDVMRALGGGSVPPEPKLSIVREPDRGK